MRTLRRLREYGTDFSAKVLNIVIGVQGHEDSECRVLGQMLAFSDFYNKKKQQLKEAANAASSVVTAAS